MCGRDWSSDVCSSDLLFRLLAGGNILNGSNQAGCRLARLPIGGTARIEPLDPAIRKHQPELEIAALGAPQQIGRASCRERVWLSVLAGAGNRRGWQDS